MYSLTKKLPSLKLVFRMPKKEIWAFPLKILRLEEGLWRISISGQAWKRLHGDKNG